MKKDTKITHIAENSDQIYYNPDQRLVDWFRKRLELEQEKRQFKDPKKRGQKPSNKFHKNMKESAARKVDVLDKIVFPSMANLMYFFEAIEISPDLKRLFEKDVKKLLDPKDTHRAAHSVSDMRFQSHWEFRDNNLYRLLENALSLDFGEKGIKIDTKNFRIALLYQLQCLILDSMDRLLQEEYGFFTQISQSALEDYRKAVGWLAFITKSTPDVKEDHDRKIGFTPITYATRGNLSQLKL